jgi:hypothetical protein
MQRIYKDQTSLRITVRTYTALTAAVILSVKFVKPDGTQGSLPASVGDALTGVMFHECIEGDIDQAGWWRFWALAEFEDGRTAAGNTARVFVWEEGN